MRKFALSILTSGLLDRSPAIKLSRYTFPTEENQTFFISFQPQYSDWELNASEGIAIVAVFVILLALIVYFFGTRRALNKARSELGDLNIQLDSQVRERTAELIQKNSELEHEISKRKKAEESLLKSEHPFRSLFELHDVIMLMIEPESGAILDANLAASNFYGYPIEKLRQMNIGEVNCLSPEELAAERRTALTEKQNFFVFPHRVSTGDIRAVEVHSTPVTINEQTLLFSIIHDVTDRKRMESALHQSEDQFRDVFNANLDGLIVVDRSGIVRLGNPVAAELLKRPIEKLVGQRFGLPTDSNESIEIDLVQPNGEFHTVEMRVNNFHWLNSPAYLVCLRDATERKRLLKQLQHQAETDVLTSISNRRHFLELASKEIVRAIRQKHPLAIAVVDLDNLKQINDTHGHALGDLVLKEFTVICQNYIRAVDVFARIGGDEFVLLLVETSADQAYQILERIRTAVMEKSLNPDGISVSFTISSGISSLENMSDTLDRLLSLADMALYRAKQAGRNKVVVERNAV